MPIFFTLHNISPPATETGIDDGQRNSRIFLIGIFLYVFIYVMLKNLVFTGKLEEQLYDTLFVALLILFLADGFVMGFIYKNYWGRSITNEAVEIFGDSKKEFDYDDETHTYIKKSDKIIKNNLNNAPDDETFEIFKQIDGETKKKLKFKKKEKKNKNFENK